MVNNPRPGWNARSLTRRALVRRSAALGAGALLVGGPLGAGFGRGLWLSNVAAAAQLADEQVMRLPTGEPVTMDPGVSYGDNELDIFFNIFDGLLGIDQKTGDIVPRCAERYEANADASEYTFYLRGGLTWSDGTPLNAHDFEWSWKRVLDPNTKSQYMPALYPIKNAEQIADGKGAPDDLGVTAVDDQTLKVTLTGATPYFPILVTTWTFFPVPKHVVDKFGEEWVEAENIVSNGPFVMTEWTHDQSIVLEPNPKYYGEAPTLTRAEYHIFADPTTQAYLAFENDELDYAAPVGPDLDRVLADPEASKNLITFPLSNCYFVVCDTTNPPTDNVSFRQALSMALDRKTLAEQVLRGQFEPAPTVLPPDIPGNDPEAALGEDVAKAKELLASAGVSDPASVSLQLVYISSPAYYKTVAEYLQATWNKNLGITVELSPIENSAYSDWRASRETQPFNLYTAVWGSDFRDPSNWDNQNFTHASDHYRNHWNDPEFDDLVAKARVNTNADERVAQYQEAEKMLVEQAPIIPLYRGKAFRAVKPYVQDLYFQPILSVVHLRTVKIAEH